MNARCRLFLDICGIIGSETAHSPKAIKELARRADVSPATLRNWLYGSTVAPRISTLIKVADALGYSIELRRAIDTARMAA